MLPIAVFIGMLEFVEGVVLRVEQLPVAPHERLVEHWVFHSHPRLASDQGSGRLRFESRYRNSEQPERPSSETSRRRNGSHRNTSCREIFLGLADGVLAEMEDRSGEHGAGAAIRQAPV